MRIVFSAHSNDPDNQRLLRSIAGACCSSPPDHALPSVKLMLNNDFDTKLQLSHERFFRMVLRIQELSKRCLAHSQTSTVIGHPRLSRLIDERARSVSGLDDRIFLIAHGNGIRGFISPSIIRLVPANAVYIPAEAMPGYDVEAAELSACLLPPDIAEDLGGVPVEQQRPGAEGMSVEEQLPGAGGMPGEEQLPGAGEMPGE